MVLFRANAITKSYLLAYRTFSTTNKKQFAELIKTLPKPVPKLPVPEHIPSVGLWKNLTFFAAIPAVLLITGSCYFLDDHHPKRPEFVPYEYMRRRLKKMQWGDGNHSLFHNEYYNALPDGYETPDHDDGHGHH